MYAATGEQIFLMGGRAPLSPLLVTTLMRSHKLKFCSFLPSAVCWLNSKQILHEMVIASTYVEHTR